MSEVELQARSHMRRGCEMIVVVPHVLSTVGCFGCQHIDVAVIHPCSPTLLAYSPSPHPCSPSRSHPPTAVSGLDAGLHQARHPRAHLQPAQARRGAPRLWCRLRRVPRARTARQRCGRLWQARGPRAAPCPARPARRGARRAGLHAPGRRREPARARAAVPAGSAGRRAAGADRRRVRLTHGSTPVSPPSCATGLHRL